MGIFKNLKFEDKFTISELYFIHKIIDEEISYCDSQIHYHSNKLNRNLNREMYNNLVSERDALYHLKKVIEGRFNES